MSVPVWTALALAYHLASRLAYVLYVGLALRRQERTGYFTRRYGPEEGFRRFRRAAAILMSSDAGRFVVLCLVRRNLLAIALARGLGLAAGDDPVVLAGFLQIIATCPIPGAERIHPRTLERFVEA